MPRGENGGRQMRRGLVEGWFWIPWRLCPCQPLQTICPGTGSELTQPRCCRTTRTVQPPFRPPGPSYTISAAGVVRKTRHGHGFGQRRGAIVPFCTGMSRHCYNANVTDSLRAELTCGSLLVLKIGTSGWQAYSQDHVLDNCRCPRRDTPSGVRRPNGSLTPVKG